MLGGGLVEGPVLELILPEDLPSRVYDPLRSHDGRPDDLDLRSFINDRIGELKESGRMKELQVKWFGFEMETPDEGYLPTGAI